MREASGHYLEKGFTAVKFGWGVFGQDHERDVELVRAARQALGDRVELLIDTGWYVHRTAKEAIQMVRRLEPFRPFLIEEPLSPEDYDGYAQLSGAVDTLIACGEQEATEWGFRTLIERGKVDVIQPDLSRCGGFTAARKIVNLAELNNRLCIPHAWISDLLTAASLHLNAFMRRSVFQEFNVTTGPMSRDLCHNPLQLEDGFARVPQGPGLGVEVNESTIEKYRVG
jgi:L-rhamnonate dehydratase